MKRVMMRGGGGKKQDVYPAQPDPDFAREPRLGYPGSQRKFPNAFPPSAFVEPNSIFKKRTKRAEKEAEGQRERERR